MRKNNLILEIDKRIGNLLIACIFFVLAAFVILESMKMPPGFFHSPGPGFYPRLLGIALGMASIIIGIFSLIRRNDKETVSLGHLNIWAVLAGIIMVAALIEAIGFILTFTLFLFVLLKMLSNLGWFRCLIFSLLGAWSAYLFFNNLLGLRLPPLYIQW